MAAEDDRLGAVAETEALPVGDLAPLLAAAAERVAVVLQTRSAMTFTSGAMIRRTCAGPVRSHPSMLTSTPACRTVSEGGGENVEVVDDAVAVGEGTPATHEARPRRPRTRKAAVRRLSLHAAMEPNCRRWRRRVGPSLNGAAQVRARGCPTSAMPSSKTRVG